MIVIDGMKLADWVKIRRKELGYRGCLNCKHQIESLRVCEWLERGGDRRHHLVCPEWERRTDDAERSS